MKLRSGRRLRKRPLGLAKVVRNLTKEFNCMKLLDESSIKGKIKEGEIQTSTPVKSSPKQWKIRLYMGLFKEKKTNKKNYFTWLWSIWNAIPQDLLNILVQTFWTLIKCYCMLIWSKYLALNNKSCLFCRRSSFSFVLYTISMTTGKMNLFLLFMYKSIIGITLFKGPLVQNNPIWSLMLV